MRGVLQGELTRGPHIGQNAAAGNSRIRTAAFSAGMRSKALCRCSEFASCPDREQRPSYFRGGPAVTAEQSELSLKPELRTMLAEHKEIVGALAKLVDAAKAESKPDIVHFAEKLMLHAQTEEQVLYPAAILVGEIVRSKLAK